MHAILAVLLEMMRTAAKGLTGERQKLDLPGLTCQVTRENLGIFRNLKGPLAQTARLLVLQVDENKWPAGT